MKLLRFSGTILTATLMVLLVRNLPNRHTKTAGTTTGTVSVKNTINDDYTKYQEIRINELKANYARYMAIATETRLPIDVAEKITRLADKYDFYDQTIVGIINWESKYDIMATNVNRNGTIDKGLMQINSNTLPWLAQVIGKPSADPFNPYDNLEMGVWYLNYLRAECNSDMQCALSKYNGDSTGKYQEIVKERIDQVAFRMGESRERMKINK
jgi:soluble lytic murein transglycosylase-like protein